MLTWVGFIGNLVEFLLEKIVGRKLDITLDERKKAARAFVDLHESLAETERLTAELLERLSPIIDGRKERIGGACLRDMPAALDRCSRDFLEALERVRNAIEIYDPALYALFSRIAASKGTILTGMSSGVTDEMKMTMQWSGPFMSSIAYTAPKQDISVADLNAQYKAAELMISEIREGNPRQFTYEWPKDALASIVSHSVVHQSIGADDVPGIRTFHGFVSSYLPTLTAARERLGSFIRENFSIEDVLSF